MAIWCFRFRFNPSEHLNGRHHDECIVFTICRALIQYTL